MFYVKDSYISQPYKRDGCQLTSLEVSPESLRTSASGYKRSRGCGRTVLVTQKSVGLGSSGCPGPWLAWVGFGWFVENNPVDGDCFVYKL